MIPMKIKETAIAEVKLIEQFRHNDSRGAFVKTFHALDFMNAGIDFTLKESFYSTSVKNVIRGMHYHKGELAHDKIIFCTDGAILDVAIDIRKSSPTFGQYVTAQLSFENNNALFIPKGFAHGFCTLSEQATTFYLVSGMYSQAHDAGLRYDSFGMQWPTNNPILSERDLSFGSLENLCS
jgi:dTDP-4-dehydrorhamnose 3,5-epimerase